MKNKDDEQIDDPTPKEEASTEDTQKEEAEEPKQPLFMILITSLLKR